MTEKIEIPLNHQDFCREVARLCRKHGLTNFGGSFQPGYRDAWNSVISFKWEAGRHEEDAGKVSIWSETRVHTNIDDREPTVGELRARTIGRSL